MHPHTLHSLCFFFFNDPAPTEIYTLSLHDALPISSTIISGSWSRTRISAATFTRDRRPAPRATGAPARPATGRRSLEKDRKSTRLNSSHMSISYAVFCLKKKKKKKKINREKENNTQ